MKHYQRPKFWPKKNCKCQISSRCYSRRDFIKLVIGKKPDAVNIQAGTNDLTHGTDTMKQAGP